MEVANEDILYHAIDLKSADEDVFVEAMEELPSLLRRPPLGIEIRVAPLVAPLRNEVLDVLASCNDIACGNGKLMYYLGTRYPHRPHIYIACSEQHKLAIACRRNNPYALWGGTLGPLAMIYHRGDRYGIWHEALHLLGAEDCYQLPDQGPTCELEGCVMQYVPCARTVGEWPFICEANIRRLQERAKRRSDSGH